MVALISPTSRAFVHWLILTCLFASNFSRRIQNRFACPPQVILPHIKTRVKQENRTFAPRSLYSP
jgi:hypothetical protein